MDNYQGYNKANDWYQALQNRKVLNAVRRPDFSLLCQEQLRHA
jgi:hypothetical protein